MGELCQVKRRCEMITMESKVNWIPFMPNNVACFCVIILLCSLSLSHANSQCVLFV